MKPVPPNQAFPDIKRILLIKLKHIGDVLLASPCVRVLHDAFSTAKISALVDEGTESMLANHPLLDEIISFPRSSMRGLSPDRVRRELAFASALRRRRFDMAVDLTSADRAAWLAWFSGARFRLARDPDGKGFFGKWLLYTHIAPHSDDPDLHEVKKNLGVLEHFGMAVSHPRLELFISSSDRATADRTLRDFGLGAGAPPDADGRARFVLVHPTSRWLFKCWEDARFAALIDWVQTSLRHPVIATCGPDPREIERARRVLSLCSTNPHAILGVLSLAQWAALARKAMLFIGVDSAPMHIATSQGTPCLALFGPTGFQNWRPWGVCHEVLVHDCPCSRDRRSHCDWRPGLTRACMNAIALEEMKESVTRLIGSRMNSGSESR
ncbi:MAG: putative lipopolysaccharide heptosyltransferase III [Verrucomicrobia bacterium]|nr:putative lipopolysaccharide heptosyltransferase III [Verrucomicrobiota bacterium]